MNRVMGVAILCGPLLLSACATTALGPPDEQIALADQALSQARQADAAEFAALEMRTAEDKLLRARALVETADPDRYREAQRLAEQAAVDAQVAAKLARVERVRRHEAELRRTVQALQRELEEPQSGGNAR